MAFDAIDETVAAGEGDPVEPDDTETSDVETSDVETSDVETSDVETSETEVETGVDAEVEAPAAEVEAPAAEVEGPAPEDEVDASEPDLTPMSLAVLEHSAEQRADRLLSVAPSAPADEAGAESWVAAAQAAPAPPPAPVTAYHLLDSRSPMPEPTEDETPIFRSLRSNWFTAGADEETWTTSEIEAGWEAAEQVAEAPALQLSESGLPMRRPGKRLVPGGVSPTPVSVDRDPEAIRARLAAHAAGVSRGRTAAVDESVTAPSSEEGPA